MPTFFDPNRLSPLQQTRWEEACTAYRRVQNDNARRLLDTLEPSARGDLARRFGCPLTDDASLLEILTESGGLLIGGQEPGHPKSALFARLLNGRDPLPYPPPTSFSYPWYAVIEEPGPFRSGDVYCEIPPADVQDAGAPPVLWINQHGWTIQARNAPAEALEGLQQRLRATETPDRTCVWTPELTREVRAAYAALPEYRVSVDPWPEYRLWVAPVSYSVGDARALLESEVGPAYCRNVFEAGILSGGHVDGPDPDHPDRVLVTALTWHLQRVTPL